MDNESRTRFIVNPAAANGRCGATWPEKAQKIERVLGACDYEYTSCRGDAERMARKALEDGARCIVAVGGDGTNNEVVNGFFSNGKAVSPEAAFGFIPVGTGGDFRKTFGWSKDFSEALSRLESGKTRTIDLGHLTCIGPDGVELDRYYINIASFGLGGLVDHYCNTTSKALGGKASFFMASLRAIIKWRNTPVKLVLNGGKSIERSISNVALANGRVFGGGMRIAPLAEVDDGRFDMVILGDLTFTEFVALSGKLYKGEHLNMPKIESFSTARLEAMPVNSGDQVLIDMDGEQPGRLPATFKVVPRALRIFAG